MATRRITIKALKPVFVAKGIPPTRAEEFARACRGFRAVVSVADVAAEFTGALADLGEDVVACDAKGITPEDVALLAAVGELPEFALWLADYAGWDAWSYRRLQYEVARVVADQELATGIESSVSERDLCRRWVESGMPPETAFLFLLLNINVDEALVMKAHPGFDMAAVEMLTALRTVCGPMLHPATG